MDLIEHGKAVLANQPFSQFLGAEIHTLKPGEAELAIQLHNHHFQQHQFVHGGVISYLADNCLTFAGGSVLGDSVTSEYKINYVRPAIGSRLIARANVAHSGKTQAVCNCNVYIENNGEEKLVAVALGTIVKAR